MQINQDIQFNQLLNMIKILPEKQIVKIKAEIDKVLDKNTINNKGEYYEKISIYHCCFYFNF